MPFTAAGGILGILLLFLFKQATPNVAFALFYTAHPLHVLFSAIVTASLFRLYQNKNQVLWKQFITVLLVGYFGSVGISTVSDSLFPYLGESLFDLPFRHLHLGFIEKPLLVNGAAVIGILFGFFYPLTKLPHSMHVFLSTFASLFHILMASGTNLSLWLYAGIFVLLFISVWIPCCFSDIVFPLLFVRKK